MQRVRENWQYRFDDLSKGLRRHDLAERCKSTGDGKADDVKATPTCEAQRWEQSREPRVQVGRQTSRYGGENGEAIEQVLSFSVVRRQQAVCEMLRICEVEVRE